MIKKSISIFFTLLFMATIVTPSIIIVLDDTVDVSVFFDFSEEEEEKGNEKNKELESFFAENNLESESVFKQEARKNVGYYFKKYPKPHLNLISPPPEFIL